MKCPRHLTFLPIKLPTPDGMGVNFLLLFSRQFMTFLGFCYPLKFPLRSPLGGEVNFLGSKPLDPDLSDSAWIYKQNITDFAKQLKHVRGFINKIQLMLLNS